MRKPEIRWFLGSVGVHVSLVACLWAQPFGRPSRTGLEQVERAPGDTVRPLRILSRAEIFPDEEVDLLIEQTPIRPEPPADLPLVETAPVPLEERVIEPVDPPSPEPELLEPFESVGYPPRRWERIKRVQWARRAESPTPTVIAAAESSPVASPAPAELVFEPAAPLQRNPVPSYPRTARRRGQEGVVVLLARIAVTGEVLETEVKESSGHRSLDEAALAALREWRFQPATRGGTRVEDRIEIPFRFSLEE